MLLTNGAGWLASLGACAAQHGAQPHWQEGHAQLA